MKIDPEKCVLIVWDDGNRDDDPRDIFDLDIIYVDQPTEARRFHEAHQIAAKRWPAKSDHSIRAFCFSADGSSKMFRDWIPHQWLESHYR